MYKYITQIIILLFLTNFIQAKVCKYSWESKPGETKYVKQYSIDTDIDGHAVRIFKTETKYENSKENCEGLKATSGSVWGYSDYIYKNGNVYGYWTRLYEDGSTMFGTWQGTSQTPKDQKKNSINISSQKITGGTGVYSNVSGYGKSKGEFNPEKGYSSITQTIFYSIK